MSSGVLFGISTSEPLQLKARKKIETATEKQTVPFKREIVWKNVAVYVVGHLMGIYGFYISLLYVPWSQFILGYVMGYTNNLLGIIIGAHRYYTHRCFKASKAMRWLMVLSQTATSQNCMWVWVRDHRQHHKYSDTDADPHNAQNGFFFSHVGWLLTKKHPLVIEKGKGIDMSDLNADPIVMFQKRHYGKLWLVFAIVIPTWFGAYVWGSWWNSFFFWLMWRTILSLNITWLVNSWAHMYGNRPYDKNIVPVESPFVSFMAMGEGWHNYHHTFPWDYKASEYGAPFNLGAHAIRLFCILGMAWDLKEASDEMIVSRVKKTGDGAPFRTNPNSLSRSGRG